MNSTKPQQPTPCLPETFIAIMLVVIFYPATIAPVGLASNGRLFGLGILSFAGWHRNLFR